VRVGILAHLLNFTPGYRQAGVSRYVEYLLRDLPAAAPEDRFIVYAGRRSAGPAIASRFPAGVRGSLSRWPTESPQVGIAWEQAIAPVALARDRIDVVHAPVQVAPLLARRPSVVTVHDLAFLVYPEQFPGIKQRYLNHLTRLSVRRATRIIAVSDNTRRDLRRFYGIDPAKTVVVPNGVGSEFRRAPSEEELALFKAGHGVEQPFILFVGTLQPRKNLVTLLRAWSRLAPSERLPLVVVGATGWLYEPIFAEARALGIADQVQFRGYAGADDLPLWYSAATVFVYPSLYEGFGLPVAEAMGCGTPVITASTSSLPEVAGSAALLVDPTDVDALTQALRELIAKPELRADLSRRGREQSRQFTGERTARETVAVYHDAALSATTAALGREAG
jgi:glycosyltransferase involved in cell wall biosynthesis